MPSEFTQAIEFLRNNQAQQALIVLESSTNTHLPLYHLLMAESHYFLDEPKQAEIYYLMPLVTDFPIAKLRLGAINYYGGANPANYSKSLFYLLPIVDGSLNTFDSSQRLFLLAEIYRKGQPKNGVEANLVKAKRYSSQASMSSIRGQGSYLQVLLAQSETTTIEIQSLYRSIKYTIVNYPPNSSLMLSNDIAVYRDWLSLLIENDGRGRFSSIGKLLLSTIKKYEQQSFAMFNSRQDEKIDFSPDYSQLHNQYWDMVIEHKNAAYLAVMMQSGFDPLAAIYGSSPMHNWINNEESDFDENDLAMMQTIFDERKAIDLWIYVIGKKTTLLHLAVHYKRKKLIAFLIDNGFKEHINLRDQAYNLTPLELLMFDVGELEYIAYPTRRMVEEEETTEEKALRLELAEYLIGQGANPNFLSLASLAAMAPEYHDLIDRAKATMACSHASINSLCWTSFSSNFSKRSPNRPLKQESQNFLEDTPENTPIPKLEPQVSPLGMLDDFVFSKAHDIIVTKHENALTLWQLSTGYKIRQLDLPEEYVYDIQLKGFSYDGQYFSAIKKSKELFVWSIYTGQLLGQLNHHTEEFPNKKKVRGVIDDDYYDFSVSTNRILVDDYSRIELIDVSGDKFFEINVRDSILERETAPYSGVTVEYKTKVLSAGLSENGQYICLLSENKELSLWNISSAEPIDVQNFDTELESLDILKLRVSNQGKYVTIVAEQGLWLWQIEQQALSQLSKDSIEPFYLSDWSFEYDIDEKYLAKNYHGKFKRRNHNTSIVFDLSTNKQVDKPVQLGTSSPITFVKQELLDLRLASSALEVKGITNKDLELHFTVDQKTGRYQLLNKDLFKDYFTFVSDGSRVTNLNTLTNEQLIEIHFTENTYRLSVNELRNLKSLSSSQKLKLTVQGWNVDKNESKIIQHLTLNDDRLFEPYTYKLNENGFAIMSSDNIFYLDELGQSSDARAIIKRQSQLDMLPILSNDGEYLLFYMGSQLQLWHLPSAQLRWELDLDSLFQEDRFKDRGFQGAYFQDIKFLVGDKKIQLISNIPLFGSNEPSFPLQPKSLILSVIDGQVIGSKEYPYKMVDAQGNIGVKTHNNKLEIHDLNKTSSLLFATSIEPSEDNTFSYQLNVIESSPDLSTVFIRYNQTQQLWRKKSDGTYQMQFDYKPTNSLGFLPDIEHNKAAISIRSVDNHLMQKMTYRLSLNGQWLIGDLGLKSYIWRLSDFLLVKVFNTEIVDLDHVWLLDKEKKVLISSTTFDVLDKLSDMNDLISSIANKELSISDNNDIIVGVENNRVFVKKLNTHLSPLYYTVFKGEQGIDWTWFNLNGYFDSNNLDNINHLVWLFHDQPLTPLAAEVFLRDFYSPGLLGKQDNWQKENRRNFNQLNRVLPTVSIDKIEYVASTHQAKVKVSVTNKQFKTKTSGAYDLHLLLNGRVVRRSPDASSEQKLEKWRQSTMLGTQNESRISAEFTVDLPRNTKQYFSFSAYVFNRDRIKSINAKTKYLAVEKTNHTTYLPRAWILSIGVNDNTNKDFRLSYASPSAQLLGEKLQAKLLASKQFSEVTFLPLYTQSQREIMAALASNEPLNPLPSKANIKAIIRHLSGAKLNNADKLALANFDGIEAKKIRPDDFIFISFSGHGISDSEEKEFYLLPYDSAKDKASGLYNRAISSAELASWLTNLPTEQSVVFLDTCTSGTALDVHEFKPAPLGNAGLGQLAYNKGMAIYVASEAGSAANAQGISLANSAFIKAIERRESVSTQQELQAIMLEASKGALQNKMTQQPSMYYFKRKALTFTTKEE